jgi:hypothetical protein
MVCLKASPYNYQRTQNSCLNCYQEKNNKQTCKTGANKIIKLRQSWEAGRALAWTLVFLASFSHHTSNYKNQVNKT